MDCIHPGTTLLGNYKIRRFGPAVRNEVIDLTDNNKIYKIDSATTTVTLSRFDSQFVQGTFSGNLTYLGEFIPMNGEFNIRK